MSPKRVLRRGDVVSGRYELEKYLGAGGMAFVYRAHDRRANRRCALKFLRPSLLSEDVDRFLAEARFAARLGAHPHIVQVHDSGLDERTGLPFICMEYLDGMTLQTFLAERGYRSAGEARRWIGQLGAALEEAHERGIVHRDLKPANIIVIDDRGRRSLKVLDFGIAKLVEHAAQATATQAGTPGYCAPEQLGGGFRALAAERGITIARHVSAATDVWALALIAYELLTAERAHDYWSADNVADLLVKIALEPRRPPSSRAAGSRLPPEFDAWFLRCLEHDAARRFPTAREAVTALDRVLGMGDRTLESASMEVTTETWSTAVGRRSPRTGARLLVGSALMVATLAATAVLWPIAAAPLESALPTIVVAAPPQDLAPPTRTAASAASGSVAVPRPRARPAPRPAASTPKSFDELFGQR